MRKLLSLVDLDDVRWAVILVLGVACACSLETAWRVEAAAARFAERQDSASTAITARLEALESRETPPAVFAPIQIPVDLPRVSFEPAVHELTHEERERLCRLVGQPLCER